MLNALAGGAENYGLYATAFRGVSLPNDAAATANGNLSLYADSVEISAVAQQWVAEHDAAQAADLHTKEGRAEQAKNYDAILAGLRDQYAEPEAMRRFDEIMRADGFALVQNSASLVSFNGYYSQHGGVSGNNISDHFLELNEILRPAGIASNLVANATLEIAGVNGKTEYLAETWVGYNAGVSAEVQKNLDDWRGRPFDDAQAQADFDLREYLNKYATNDYATVAGVSSDLAALTGSLLAKAGITLNDGESIAFFLADGGSGPQLNATLNRATGAEKLLTADERLANVARGADERQVAIETRLNDLLKNDKSLLTAFLAENQRLEKGDVSGLASFTDESRSVSYDVLRRFIYSASETSAVVVADSLRVDRRGYTYEKKISDQFETQADNFMLNVSASTGEMWDGGRPGVVKDPAGFAQKLQARENELTQKIRDAATTGGAIASTLSREEFSDYKSAKFQEQIDNLARMGMRWNAGGGLEIAVLNEETNGKNTQYFQRPDGGYERVTIDADGNQESAILAQDSDELPETLRENGGAAAIDKDKVAAKNRRNDLTNYLITDFPAVADFAAQHANQRDNIKSMVLEAVFGRQSSANKNYGVF
ncbi:MAG: hypothetical protein LBP75_07875 [Planctomycetota bacterium]|jgi:hypothetical protein|nr:hypothetical protein [Planctomycetota bacterium]